MSTLKERAALKQRAAADPKLQAVLNEQCKRDIIYWFNNFCWTFNPRQKPFHFPFNLYPYQEKMVLEIKDCIEKGDQVLIKKSRDMGVTWLILLVFQWFWLYEPGSDFHMTSITEDDVDEIGNKSTLFEKLRYNYEWLPRWMKPNLAKQHDSYMKLINPDNGNSITGQAPVTNFGRSQRYKAVLMDEMSQLKNGAVMYSSVTESAECIIMPYTPYGKDNEAFRLANSGDLNRVSLE